jgi:hypothetical protein
MSDNAFHIAGDVPDPTGLSKNRGVAATVDFTEAAAGHPKIIAIANGQGRVITADVYKLPGEPMTVHLICPKCENALKVSQDNKAIEYNKDERSRVAEALKTLGEGFEDDGTISIEKFECTWESDPSSKRDFGFARCGWKVEIDRNIAREV